MNPRARRLRTRCRQQRARTTKIVCQADRPIPETLAWDFGADTLSWGHSTIQLATVRARRWPWSIERNIENLMHLHPTYQERWHRRLQP